MSTQAKIGWLPSSLDPAIASARLRCFLPCQYLREAGWNSEIFDERCGGEYDLVVFQKVYDERAIRLAESLRERGTVVVFDLCDNHFYNPDNLPALTERAQRLRRMIEVVDAVSVSTEPLRELVPEAKSAGVVDDALDQLRGEVGAIGRLRIRLRSRGRRLRLVWFGNAGLESPPFGLVHLPKVFPALADVSVRHPLELSVISNSREAYEKAVGGAPVPTRYFEWNPASFVPLFRSHQICIIPVQPNPFTICKTGNRVALSLALEVPVIADPIPSFEEFAPFILLDDWREGLEQYASDPPLRREHATSGRRYVEKLYTKERVVSQWSAVFARLLEHRSDRTDRLATAREP